MSTFAERAAARKSRIEMAWSSQAQDREFGEVHGAAALSLVTTLSRTAWSLTRQPVVKLARHELPCRFIPGTRS